MAIPVKKMLSALRHPKRIFGYYYRGVDFWPPQNFRRHYRIKFYLIELPVRWMFKGVFPQRWDGRKFRTFFDEDLFIDKKTDFDVSILNAANSSLDKSNRAFTKECGILLKQARIDC